jgi:hypothetical protein
MVRGVCIVGVCLVHSICMVHGVCMVGICMGGGCLQGVINVCIVDLHG